MSTCLENYKNINNHDVIVSLMDNHEGLVTSLDMSVDEDGNKYFQFVTSDWVRFDIVNHIDDSITHVDCYSDGHVHRWKSDVTLDDISDI